MVIEVEEESKQRKKRNSRTGAGKKKTGKAMAG